MKNRIITSSLRQIKNSKTRFIALLILSLLGVFAFVGLQSTAPDMIYSLDSLYDEYNVYDIKLQSALGLTNKDLDYFNSLDLDCLEASKSIDALYKNEKNESVIQIISIPNNINNIKIIEGRLPINPNEIVVEESLLKNYDINIGDEIEINTDKLKNNKVIITGTVYSPLFINSIKTGNDRGKTNIGSGKINYYSYMMIDSFNFNYYTSIYFSSNKAKSYETSSNNYLNEIDLLTNKLTNHIEATPDDTKKQIVDELFEDKIAEINREYANKLQEINDKEKEIDELVSQYSTEDNPLNRDNLMDYYNLLININPDFASKIMLIIEAYNEIDEARLTLENTKDNALIEIEELKLDIYNNLDSYYHIYDRTDHTTYNEYIDDALSISNLAKIFPVLFFLVAILVSLVSMNRMVEEDRANLGTLKSLGFSNIHIITKYVIFSISASIVGGLLGALLGSFIIPALIFNIYTILFSVPKLMFKANIISIIIGFLITIICIVGTTIYTAYKTLKEKPSELLRPKAPKAGKRILLEKIKPIWSRLSFSKKIICRNLFRYKKRALVTIFGIAGCSALMLAGFGIKDSIVDIPKVQYEDIYKSDAIAYSSNKTEVELEDTFNSLNQINNHYSVMQINAKIESKEGYILVLPENDNRNEYLSLKDKNNDEEIILDNNTCAISDKLSELLNININDSISVIDNDGNEFNLIVSHIIKNYINHYIYISKDCYLRYNLDFNPNMTFFNTIELNEAEKLELSKELLETNNVLNVIYSNELIATAEDMLGSLNKVVYILVILSMILSFVVLYNLSNINMQERKREISTLKVLGFYDNEVDSYITSENIILTIIGIIIGLVLGYFLAMIVTKTVEIDRIRFIYGVKLLSYILTSLFSIIFTFIVNFIAHFSLRKIDMIESLKSVE